MNENLRVAFFPDSYLEVNGAAMTCRRLVDYAKDKKYPLLIVYAGPKTELTTDGSVTYLSLKRSLFSITLDEDLAYDPFFFRHMGRIRRELVNFKPDVIHITGVNDVSINAAILGHRMDIPRLGSWHTNVHEFASSRLERMLAFAPGSLGKKVGHFAETQIMRGAMLYYKMPQINLAPNQELVDILEKRTGRPARIMGRGVDTDKFSPERRTVNDGILRFGSVGRLRPEKNVRMLVEIEKALLAAGKTNFKFLIVGEGSERKYLEENMKTAEFTGFLKGDDLSEAYANMDVFLFTSETETFGNVAQEANASGSPAIVTDKGGPRFIIKQAETGFIASNLGEFIKYAIELYDDRDKLAKMKVKARESAMSRSWDSIFDGVYDGYRESIRLTGERKTRNNG